MTTTNDAEVSLRSNLGKLAISQAMRLATLLLVLVPAIGQAAAEDWLCKNESSQVLDGTLQSCGIGEGKDENEGRAKAFENAKAEFLRVCKSSDTCRGRKVSVEPKRTTCEQAATGYRCYRLVAFSIDSGGGTAGIGEDAPAKVGRSASVKDRKTELSKFNDRPDHFAPFVFDPEARIPRVYRGQSKADLLLLFGAPGSVGELSFKRTGRRLMFHYEGKMCLYNLSCSVVLEDSVVESYSNFKPIYTEDLK